MWFNIFNSPADIRIASYLWGKIKNCNSIYCIAVVSYLAIASILPKFVVEEKWLIAS